VPKVNKTCSVPDCPEVVAVGRCATHQRAADLARGSAAERGYSSRAYRVGKRVVLRRDPICTACGAAPSSVPDHHPVSRRDLVAAGVRNPDHPSRMRGVCARCHGRQTAVNQPGGWNAR
jgi:5-methylcytosine-specific restriction protein A